MPSASPGSVHSTFDQILPGAPNDVLQSVTTFVYRHERYVAYLSGSQLNLLSSPGKLVHTIRFANNLIAVTAHHTSGRLVVATQECAYLLEPVAEGWKTIWWEKRLLLSCDDEPRTLSWSKDDELLVGGSKYLNLFSTTPPSRNNSPAITPIDGEPMEERRPLWSEVLASPVQYASFSSTADMIASCGQYSKLIKIWRRLSFEDGLFDYTYLPHPATVTHLEWRIPDESAQGRRGSGISGRHDEELEVLYTIAINGLLRVWRSAGVHDIEILTLHTVIDLVAAIPHSPSLSRSSDNPRRPRRFVFILTAEQFQTAVLAATGRVLSGKLSHSLEHLKEISSNSPDVIVSIDNQGRMSAWGLQSVGHKRRPESPNLDSPFHIMQTEGLQLGLADVPNARFQTWFDDDRLQILAHTFDGKCTWWQGQAETFFSHATPGAERLEHLAEWSGHTSQPKSIRRNASTGDLSSWDESNSIVLWEQSSSGALRMRGTILGGDTIADALPLQSLGAVLTLHESQLKLWNTAGKLLQNIDHSLHGSTSTRIWSARTAEGQDRHVLLLNDRGSYQIVTVTAASKLSHSEVEHATKDDAVAAVATDDGHGGLIVVSLDAGGKLRRNLTRDDASHRKVKTALSTFDTGITVVDSLSASTAHAFIVSQKGRRLSIFDTSGGYKEHEGDHGEDISHVSCFTSKSGGTMVATAHRSTVDILVQDRYKSSGAWSSMQSVEVHSMSLKISGLNWTAKGELLVLAGNSILQANTKIADSHINAASITPHGRLSALANTMRLPLPIWHPGVLQYLVRSGKASSAIRILGTLSDKLRFWTEGDHVPWQLDLSTDGIMRNAEEPPQTENTFTSLLEQIGERGVPLLTSIEQDKLRQTITAIEYIAQHMRGLDLCALQYLFSWKLGLLRLKADQVERSNHEQPNGHEPGTVPPLVPDMNWREITFAYHSTTQQPLWDLLILHYDNKMTWEIARRLGVTMWLADREALARVFESLAQSAYRATDPPDPTNASLYFLALDKKPTLLSLWRIATWHNEQRMTMNFLKRDFAQPSAQTAAKKNAYALMGRRRFEYAAAFFLLANDGPSAVSLLAGQCEDVMLAVAVARLYANEAGSATLQKLLQERLLPQAQQAKDRWLTCWCHSLLDQNSQAAEALISPLQGVRTWQQDDPQTLTLYRHLRKKPSHHEYASVLRSATILRRMGLWLPALTLVKEWIFEHSPAMMNGAHKEVETTPEEATLHGESSVTEEVKLQPPSMLDDYTTPPPTDDKAVREAKAAELLKKLKEKKTSKIDSEPKTEPKRDDNVSFHIFPDPFAYQSPELDIALVEKSKPRSVKSPRNTNITVALTLRPNIFHPANDVANLLPSSAELCDSCAALGIITELVPATNHPLWPVALALAKPRALLARQAVGPACDNEAAQDGTACLGFNTVQAASFCSLTLTIPTKTRTITETSVYEFTVTSFSPLITETATPPVTTSITLLTTFNTTAFANQTTVLSSGTKFVATTTVGVTDTLTQYTCGLPSSFSGQPSPVALAGNLRPKILPAAYAAATTTPTIPLPSCFPSFINEYGQKGVTSACNCYGVYGPTFTSTEVETVTQTSVSIVTTVVPGTTTITPVNTATYFNTSTQIETVTSIITNQVPLYPNATSTATSRTTVTVSTTSPRPTSNFHLFLTIPSLPFFPPQYAYAVNTTDDSGTVISFSPNEINADTFALDPQLRLIDRSEGGEFTAINSKDVYPWFYLDSVAETNNTALCFTCGQDFRCTLPGRTQEQVWAVCDGYLALGPASTFVQTRDCVVVELGYNLGVA